MCEEERIRKDITLFEANISDIEDSEVVELARAYYEDAKYYLEKGDLFTAFGCINYAHGLIDGIKKLTGTSGTRAQSRPR